MGQRSVLDNPLVLGLDRMAALAEHAAKVADAYPPYNIEVLDNGFCITVAVSGFMPDELDVSVDGRQLYIRGAKDQARAQAKQYLHRGIATRKFQRVFVLADGLEVAGADCAHGLLHVKLLRPAPASRRQTIPIRDVE